ncbi:MAG TPA: endonuclease/exonuclease/phosphatase [Terriglobia bacterium]|nr:endonuclease/exonuclease/phosphatase [Terriglobia bacterium]
MEPRKFIRSSRRPADGQAAEGDWQRSRELDSRASGSQARQLASIIRQLGGGLGPDLLGVCGVESATVLQMLVSRVAALTNRDYTFVHFDTVDQRGIDIAFIFRPELFTAPADQRFPHVVMRRTATREILQVNFQTNKNRTWAVFGNHWPSRSGGQFESEGYREIAGETLGYFHQRVLEVHGEDTPGFAMGDFNDEPFNKSLTDHALSVQQRAKVLNATSRPLLLNMMWEAAGRREGSLYFDNSPNLLDQFLVNRNMLRPTSSIRAC